MTLLFVIIPLFSSIPHITKGQYAMGDKITCWENNRYSYAGYHDPGYVDDPDYIAAGGQGDVCDHLDPDYGEIRDSCYFQVWLGEETWSYKCMYHENCPLKDAITGEGIMGCVNITNKRITCCCDGDLCNGEAYIGYADLGYPENFTPETTESNNRSTTWIIEIGNTSLPTWPIINATEEECSLVTYNTKSCSCGTMCSSFEREYFALCPKKCGDQILRTGEFGKEKCDLNDFFAKDMEKNYSLIVLPCHDGEFAFSDHSFKLNGLFVAILMTVYCVLFVY